MPTPDAKPDFELVSHRLCPYVQRAAIVLAEKDVPFRRTIIDLADRPDWFRKLSPLGKVPLLMTDDEVLFESAVIAEYLDEITPGRMLPADPLARARHRATVEFVSALLSDIAGFYSAKDTAALEEQRAKIRSKLEWLEDHLGDGPFFAGQAFGLVDAAMAPAFRYFDAFVRIAEFGFMDGLTRLGGWQAALAGRPSVIGAVAPDYPNWLWDFLRARGSELARRMESAAAA